LSSSLTFPGTKSLSWASIDANFSKFLKFAIKELLSVSIKHAKKEKATLKVKQTRID
jgi:hypothetical protein